MQTRFRPCTTRAGLVLGWLFAMLCGSAIAQTVYKCSGPAGQPVAYQQTPCAPGLHGEAIRLAPIAAPAPDATAAPARSKPATRAPRPASDRPRASPTPISYECRSAGGAVFYRHARCPASIPRRAGAAPRAAEGVDRVQATALPRAEACRRQRRGARDGAEHDETVSTYERNLGRDPCRRY